MFLKHWYSISETVNLLNKYFKINALPNTITDFFGDMGSIQFTEKDILNFYNDEYLRFSIRVKKIDNSIPIIHFFNHRIEMNSYLYDSFDDEKIVGIYSISTDDSVIYSDNDGYLYAKGLFKLPVDFTEITKDKFIVSSIKIYDDEELGVECENGNVNYIYNIAFPCPIEIEKDLVLISRKEIISLISMIKQENQYANEAIIHNTSYQKENYSIIKQQANQIAELQAQLKEKEKRIAELEAEKQNLKKPEPLGDNYNPTERGTHLQAIAILAIREAERKPMSLMTNTGKIKNSSIADILAKEAKTLFTNPRDKDAFRRRLAEALKTYETQAE